MADQTTDTLAEDHPDDFSFLDIPDEDLGKYSPGSFQGSSTELAATEESAATSSAAASDDTSEDEASQESSAASVTAEAPAAAQDDTEEDEADSGEATGNSAAKVEVPAASKETKSEEPAAEKPAAPQSAVDYEAEYKRLVAPFKANGKEIAVQSVDDAIALMQMGANYTKKMAALKPNLALLKMLENNGLLSEERIGFLIDLSKKDSGAINKLIKDSGIDPLDLNTEKASDYKPGSHRVDDREVELDSVLDEIQSSKSYGRTIAIVSKEWDAASKQTIADSPQLLKVINSHVEAGIYDLISQEVEREKMFGRLQGLSDFDAYRQVGDAIQARKGFDHLGRQGQPTPTQQPVAVSKPKVTQEDDQLKEKRRAAASSKPVTSAAIPKDFNPLALSDAEFSKLARSKYA